MKVIRILLLLIVFSFTAYGVSFAQTSPVLNSIGPQSVDEGSILNFGISATDADFIGRMYPKPANEIILDAPPRSESISQFGEIDTFTFLIFEPGSYRMETEGRTDLIMMLYGPEDDTRFIAMDDDSGRVTLLLL